MTAELAGGRERAAGAAGARERTAERLLRSTAARAYDPDLDIDWSAPLAEGKGYMLPHRCTLYGTALWQQLSDQQRLELSKHEAASAVTAASTRGATFSFDVTPCGVRSNCLDLSTAGWMQQSCVRTENPWFSSAAQATSVGVGAVALRSSARCKVWSDPTGSLKDMWRAKAGERRVVRPRAG